MLHLFVNDDHLDLIPFKFWFNVQKVHL